MDERPPVIMLDRVSVIVVMVQFLRLRRAIGAVAARQLGRIWGESHGVCLRVLFLNPCR